MHQALLINSHTTSLPKMRYGRIANMAENEFASLELSTATKQILGTEVGKSEAKDSFDGDADSEGSPKN